MGRFPDEYIAIRSRIRDLYRELNTGDYDRAEVTIGGFEIRLWKETVNCRTKTILGWKMPWHRGYKYATVLELTEMLYCYESARTCPNLKRSNSGNAQV